MNPIGFRACMPPLVWILSAGMVMAADNSNLTLVDWDTRTASCPAKVTQSTNLTLRVTDINDLLIDFKTGETAQYQLRAKGTPVSVVPSENPFLQQAGVQCPQDAVLLDHLNAVRAINDPRITPPQPGGPYIPVSQSVNAAGSHPEVVQAENDYLNSSCLAFFSSHSADAVVQWIKRLVAPSTSGGTTPPAHSVDFNVNLEPNQNYEFTVQMLWKGKVVDGGTLKWNCGETDILTLSIGPLITTLPYRTYTSQSVPVTGGGTQNQLVVSGNTNVNVQGAALLNYHFPQISVLPAWTGLAFSVGPVYTLNSTPSVSKLGLFAGGSVQMYRSVFLTAGVHIGEFADYPAGFHQGSVIPSGFGSLNPVTRNTARFAIGITFKTTSFKKSSQNNGAATNTGANPKTTKPSGNQPVSGSHGTGAPGNPNQPPPPKPKTTPETPQ